MAMQMGIMAEVSGSRVLGRVGLSLVLLTALGAGCKKKERASGSSGASGSAGSAGSSGTPNATSIGFDESSTSFAAFKAESVRLAAMQYPAIKDAPAIAPISLTADDGTGLVLEALDARAVIEGPLAFTELHMRFRNPLSRVLEGRFQVTLPAGASVSRLSMKVNGNWQEAEMVERQAARRAYEDFLHRKQDPMLLEKEAGNQFRARIFPIPANGVKEVVLSYSHEISAKRGYRLPLRGLPEVGELKVKAMVAEADGSKTRYKTQKLEKKGEVPTADFRIAAPPTLQALRQGTHVVARVQPKIDVGATKVGGLTILFDTSASRAPGFARQVQRLGSLVKEIASAQGASLPIRVAAFDQETAPIYEGSAGGFGKNDLALLLARRPLGASDLGAALRWAGERKSLDRVLIISDAVSTAGESELAGIAKELPQGITRIDALLVGGIRDEDAAARIVRGTRSQDGVVLRDDLSDEEIAMRLGAATVSLEVGISGADWTWPKTVHGVQPGDEIVVYGAFAAGKAPGDTVAVEIEGAENVSLKSALVPGQLLTRSVVQAQISRYQGLLVEEKDPLRMKSLKDSIIAMSTKFRVLSDYTALLVLETDNDYRRFGIDRKALVDILTVQEGGLSIQQQQRSFTKPPPLPIAVAPQEPADTLREVEEELGDADDEDSGGIGTKMAEAEGKMARNESARPTGQFAMKTDSAAPRRARPKAKKFSRESGILGALQEAPSRAFDSPDAEFKLADVGVGPGGGGSADGSIATEESIGTIGSGSGTGVGYGTGRSQGVRGRRASPPSVRARIATATGTGTLDRNIIRRYIRRVMPRLRQCYEKALLVRSALAGTVTVAFTITGQGSVQRARANGIGNTKLQNCMAKTIKSIQFPKPTGGGTVTVSYPFILATGSATSSQPSPRLERRPPPAPSAPPAEPTAWGNTGDVQPAERLQATVDPNLAALAAEKNGPPALTGTMAKIHKMIDAGQHDEAVSQALAWRTEESGNVMAIVALGESLEAAGKIQLAARAYGSIIDLFPSRADLRRFASTRLVALKGVGEALSVDSLKKAAVQRPDHLSVHRLLAYALVRNGELEEGFAALELGLKRSYPRGRFSGGKRILRADLGIVGRAWLAKDESKSSEIKERLQAAGGRLANQPSLRFVLNWETDANDVDFHIYDGQGGHAYYSQRKLSSGGELYEDVTNGYGPECFAIEGETIAFPYALQIHYYSRGPMGYGMGQVEILQHDGKGGLAFDARPFVVMSDSAYLALGPINKPL